MCNNQKDNYISDVDYFKILESVSDHSARKLNIENTGADGVSIWNT
ncbi:MAG: hypothetical protein LBB21_06765 [Holosporaceae bacterium]|jgi:hypothetical protein|nr:hypothetical protein [Holosporaceae bacterium]